ncbi:unnamed protein product [Rotaria sordida]|uniref:Uncharacterized protein n=1 Tax=Rotaria sordida TaxID=392033 RepID=A0A814THF1_9BILA|nr:unnamed protein product [Rotaria sordida]
MLSFQTLSCLHDIPLVRSSTNKIQDVYAKAKDTSAFIRIPCNLAETVADKTLKVAFTIANPVVKPFSGPVYAIDNYAAQTIRQFESKYPVITTPTENVVNTFNETTKPVLDAVNSVRDTTTSTIQHGKEAVSNVATATVNKASGVADSVFSFCGTRVPGMQRSNAGKTSRLIQSSLLWFRMLIVNCILITKQTNESLLNKMQQKRFLPALPQRLLILVGTFLEKVIRLVKPNDATLAEWEKARQQNQSSSLLKYFFDGQSLKPNQSSTARKKVVINQRETVVNRTNDYNHIPKSQPDYSNMTDTEELHARLAANDLPQSYYNMDNRMFTTESVDDVPNNDITQLHDNLKPTDVELLYSRLPTDMLPNIDGQEPLNEDQQQLHARIIGAALADQGYPVDENDNDDRQ